MNKITKINLEPLPIGDILDKQFFIPHYQRGYRWTEQQVEQLLDDIDSFSPREIPGKEDEKTFYCLQPVVVKLLDEEIKKKKELEGDWYEVVDGQQRLTTMFIIIQYINQKWLGEDKLDQFKINFETRTGCVNFLENLKVNIDDTVNIDSTYIDYYHISKALFTIRQWQLNYRENKGKQLNTANFQSTFIEFAKIIWYQVSENEKNSRDLFERLNLGKIPLTNAELTKALFLSSESFKDLAEEERRIKQYEIARLWDEIEHKLNEPDLKYWSFITNKKRETYQTKIELVLDLISGKKDDEKDQFFTFLKFSKKQKNGSLSSVWENIEHFYYTLSEWYLDQTYYHKIGYLVTARHFGKFKGVDLGEMVKDSLKMPKDEFIIKVDGFIKESVKVELSELRYDNHYNQIFNVLLLFNVETNRLSDAITEFYPFKQHKSNLWSLEHIHARNSENFDKMKREPWIKWLELHRSILGDLSNKSEEFDTENAENIILKINAYCNDRLTWQRFSSLFSEINEFFTIDSDDMDKDSEGIRNLALLSQYDNSALNNSVFEVKRREIINLDKKGNFIPVCTRRAFMKYYTEDVNQSQNIYWSKNDCEAYYNELFKTIKPFLPKNYIENENDTD